MNYQIWIVINIKHSFFREERSGIELYPTDETILFMNKAGILFRRKDTTSWYLIRNELVSSRFLNGGKHGKYPLNFRIRTTAPELEYATKWTPQKDKHWEIISQKGLNDEWILQIETSIWTDQKDIAEVDVVIESQTFGWEFILIPKYSDQYMGVELREERGKITFSEVEKIVFPGEKKAFRCVTENKVPMRSTYDYTICLWGKKENGEVLLSSHVPVPKATTRSVIEPFERICTYYYF